MLRAKLEWTKTFSCQTALKSPVRKLQELRNKARQFQSDSPFFDDDCEVLRDHVPFSIQLHRSFETVYKEFFFIWIKQTLYSNGSSTPLVFCEVFYPDLKDSHFF